MVICETERLVLRDFTKADIEKRIEWETVDREWLDWDAPWERENDLPVEEMVQGLEEFADMTAAKGPDDMRFSFQIDVKETGEYIGWISCYCIDDNYEYTDDDALFAFGIDIPPQSCRGKGYGYEAFKAAIEYLQSKGMKEIYTQTWSGNTRMIALAEKLGFREICRKKDYREVRGKKYDGLTFVYRGDGVSGP